MLIDAFIFYNELDMLYYRLSLLYDLVDKFVLVEATKTFIGHDKPLFFQENRARFEKFLPKIVHIIDDGLIVPNVEKKEQWSNESHQRNCINRGLEQLTLHPSDHIIISDVDEIPNPAVLKALNPSVQYIALSQDMFYYNLNFKQTTKWAFPKIVSYIYYAYYLKSTPQACRENWGVQGFVPNGGWHLSYFGDVEYIRNKIANFSHQEYNNESITCDESIIRNMKAGTDLFNRGEGISFEHIPIASNPNSPPMYLELLSRFI